jgi:hypothetical protein
MRLSLLVPVALLSAGACCGLASSDLGGSWEWYALNPGGNHIDLSLTDAGSNVTGTGQVCSFAGCSSATITGQHSCAEFSLTLQGSGGVLATYSGQVVSGQLRGTWTEAGQSSTLVFSRP